MPIRSHAEIEAAFDVSLPSRELLVLDELYNRVDQLLEVMFESDLKIYSIKVEGYFYHTLSEKALDKIVADYLAKNWEVVVTRFLEDTPTFARGLIIDMEDITP
jgi:hypothetical protein